MWLFHHPLSQAHQGFDGFYNKNGPIPTEIVGFRSDYSENGWIMTDF